MIYLDANASEPLRPEARAAWLRASDAPGNPASVHGAGRAARRILEDSREALATRFGASPAGIVFTSGATEALALGIAALGRGRRVIIGATEHDAVRAAAPEATVLPVGVDGRASLADLAGLLDGPPALVCLMLANNETGVIHDIPPAAALCRAAGALLLVDAVQAAGRIAVDLSALGADALALSSHKLGGPTGAGALLLAPGREHIPAMIGGGGQERFRRGGTPALAAIAGFAAAAALATVGDDRISRLRDACEDIARASGALVVGEKSPRLPNTTCLLLPGIRADTQVIALDLAGVAVSAGAACSSGKVGQSHVLTAMGFADAAGSAIRVSLPWNATQGDVDAFARAYRAMARNLLHRRAA